MTHYAGLVVTYGPIDEYGLYDMLGRYDENNESNDPDDTRFDWFQVGGRFIDALTLKDGSRATQAPVSELRMGNTDEDEKSLREEFRFLVSDKNDTPFYGPGWYLAKYGTEDVYVDANAPNVFRVLVGVDGEWDEVGRAGWFGMSDESPDDWKAWSRYFQERIDSYMKEGVFWATVVDFHV